MTYDTHSGGRVFLVWSQTAVPNAILSAAPTTTVPGYKFKGGGRTELVRGASSAKKFYEGVCAFVKSVAAYNCVLQLLPAEPPEPLLVVLLDKSNNVFKLGGSGLPLEGKRSVAALSSFSSDYDVKILNATLFITKATSRNGAAVEFA